MPKFIIKKIDNYKEWDEFLEKSPQKSIFSTSQWLKALSRTFAYSPVIYGCYKNSQLAGGCALIKKQKYNVCFSSPKEMLMPYQPIILKESDFKRDAKEISQNIQIISTIGEKLEENFNYICLINHPNFLDARPLLWRNWEVKLRYNFVLELDAEENFYSNFRRSLRKQISKAEKLGISIVESDRIDYFYELVEKSYAKHNKKFPIPLDKLSKLFTELNQQKLAKLYLAKAGDQVTSARIILCAFDTLHDWLAGADTEEGDSSATPYLIWHILRKNSKNYKYFDFGGATYLPSIARFKNNFGGKLIPYYFAEKYSSSFLRSLIKFHQFIKNLDS